VNTPSFAVFDRHGVVLPDTIRTGPEAEQAAKDAACRDETYWMTRVSTWGELEQEGYKVKPFDVQALQRRVAELERRHEEDRQQIHELRDQLHAARLMAKVRELEGADGR
jgi:hypothetical protein